MNHNLEPNREETSIKTEKEKDISNKKKPIQHEQNTPPIKSPHPRHQKDS